MSPQKPTFLSIMNGQQTPTLLRELSERLKALAEEKETPTTRAEIEAALHCKWREFQHKAILILGIWGGKQNKRWLLERARRPLPMRAMWYVRSKEKDRWEYEETNTARKAVWPLLDENDADWLLDMWFDDYETTSYLSYALQLKLPLASVEKRTKHELRSSVAARRKAALYLVFCRASFPDRMDILHGHTNDKDNVIASMATRLLEWDAHRKSIHQSANAPVAYRPVKF